MLIKNALGMEVQRQNTLRGDAGMLTGSSTLYAPGELTVAPGEAESTCGTGQQG